MKAEWRQKRLDEVCQLLNGLWKGEKPPFLNVGVYRNTNFAADASLDHTDVAYLDVELKKLEKRKLLPGDLILEKSGGGPKQPVGRVALFERDDGAFSFSNFTSAVRVLDPRELDYRFLKWFLHGVYVSGQTTKMQSNATGIRNLDADAYKAIEVPLPPLPEQRRIAAILDEAFEGIAKARANAYQNIENARAVFESHLEDSLSPCSAAWSEKRLDELCAITSTLVDPRESAYRDLIHVGAGNIETATGRLGELRTAREEKLISGKFTFDRTMVLYSKIRPYLKKVARPDFEGLCSADMYPLAPTKGVITRDYLFYLLLTKKFTDYAVRGSARAGMPKVNREHLFNFRVSLPNVREQCTIASRLDELQGHAETLVSAGGRKLAALDELKKSLLQHAFDGEL